MAPSGKPRDARSCTTAVYGMLRKDGRPWMDLWMDPLRRQEGVGVVGRPAGE